MQKEGFALGRSRRFWNVCMQFNCTIRQYCPRKSSFEDMDQPWQLKPETQTLPPPFCFRFLLRCTISITVFKRACLGYIKALAITGIPIISSCGGNTVIQPTQSVFNRAHSSSPMTIAFLLAKLSKGLRVGGSSHCRHFGSYALFCTAFPLALAPHFPIHNTHKNSISESTGARHSVSC